MNAVLELRQVSRVHGAGDTLVRAVAGVDLTVVAGELVALMGPSGSGKTTLLHLAGGLDVPTAGSVHVLGEDLGVLGVKGRARIRRTTVGYVFQEYNLVPALTALENVALPAELDGLSRTKARAAARAALERVGVGHLAQRYPDQMSGGQQQRVAIARGIVGDRRVVLADEPTGALDSETGEGVLELLRSLADDGVAVVMVTHEARHAGWADRVVFLRDGRVVDQSSSSPFGSFAGAGA